MSIASMHVWQCSYERIFFMFILPQNIRTDIIILFLDMVHGAQKIVSNDIKRIGMTKFYQLEFIG